MAIDLGNLVSQTLSPQVVSQLATTVGVNATVAQRLVSGAIPAVIGALANAASQPGGAQKISDFVSNADPDVLTKLKSALSAGQSPMLSQGAQSLSAVLGGSGLASLAGALAQFSGANAEAAQSALGAVTHAVAGAIGQQDPSNWNDAASITNFLNSQRSAIASALPSGLGGLLSASGVLGSLAAAAAPSSAAASSAASASTMASGASPSPMSPATSAGNPLGVPIWAIVVILVIVVVLVWWYLSGSKKEEKPATGYGAPAIEYALSAVVLP